MKDGRVRFAIGAFLVAAVVGVVACDRGRPVPVFGPSVLALLGAGALAEFLRLAPGPMPRPLRQAAWFGGAGVLLVPLLHFPGGARETGGLVLLAMPGVLLLLGLTVLRLRWRTTVPPGDLGAVGMAWLGAAITALPLALLAAAMRLPEGVFYVLVVVLGSKLNDIGGYVVGSTLGRRRLCPGISPNKSWEGAVGGVVLGTGGTVLLAALLPGLPAHLGTLEALALGAALAVSTQAGDLLESLIKRSAGVKDSGRLLPAFGGLLDLVDSLIFAGPVGYTLGVVFLDAS